MSEGPQRRETDEDVARRELEAEERKWTEEGLPGPQVSYAHDDFLISCAIDALSRILVEKGITTENEILVMRLKVMTENMIQLRGQMIQARRQDIVARVLPTDGLPFEK